MLSSAKSRKSRRLVVPVLVISMILGLFPVPGLAETYTFNPVADATVYVGSDFNWGLDANLSVQSGVYSYLKFDLSGLSLSGKSIPANEQITGATFNAFCNYGTPAYNFTIQLRPVADTSWSETVITGKAGNYPAIGTTVIDTYLDGRQGEYNQWTVAAAYLPRGLVSYALVRGTGTMAIYNSRHGSNKPNLVVTTKKKPLSPAANNLLLLDE